jgi:hypothetical protein
MEGGRKGRTERERGERNRGRARSARVREQYFDLDLLMIYTGNFCVVNIARCANGSNFAPNGWNFGQERAIFTYMYTHARTHRVHARTHVHRRTLARAHMHTCTHAPRGTHARSVYAYLLPPYGPPSRRAGSQQASQRRALRRPTCMKHEIR